jgi:hypothetical protein
MINGLHLGARLAERVRHRRHAFVREGDRLVHNAPGVLRGLDGRTDADLDSRPSDDRRHGRAQDLAEGAGAAKAAS